MNVKTPDYQRLVIHLKFFLQRMYAAAPSPLSLKMENYDYVLLKHLQQDYARAYHCMEDVDRFMQQKLAIAIPKNEQIYLTMHIARLAKSLAEWKKLLTRANAYDKMVSLKANTEPSGL